MGKFLGFDNVLCLSPHPDDVEYSMSGTISKYCDTNFDILCLTLGTSSDDSTGNWRVQEVFDFWDELSVENIKLHFNSNSFENLNEGQWISLIEKIMEMGNYDAIIATSDCDSHYEHLITNRLLVGLGRNKEISLLEYKSPSTLSDWTPNLFVHIDNFYNYKIEALRSAFKSQIDALYFSEECIKLFHEDYTIRKRGGGLIESFKIKNHII